MKKDPFTAPEYDKSALITIDIQNDTLNRRPFEVPGTSDILSTVGSVAQSFRMAKRPIVHILRIYEQDGTNADRCRRSALKMGKKLFIRGSNGRRVADPLLPDTSVKFDDELLLGGGVQQLGPLEFAIYKPRWGAFFRTPLESFLAEQGISTLVFCGSNFPNCPRTSIYEAGERDFRLVVVEDGVSGLHSRGKEELEKIGVRLITSDEMIGKMALHQGASHAVSRG